MRLNIFTLLLFGILNIISAQKHDYVWVRGTGAPGVLPPEYHESFMDFKTNPPTITIGKKNWPMLNCKACISDSTGKLLFFTNLLQVYNANEDIMINGDTINFGKTWKEFKNSGYPAIQCAKIIPIKSDSQFLMIYGSTDKPSKYLDCSPIKYAIIDPYYQNGKGKVVKKDIAFHDKNTLNYQFVKHGNGIDWWLILTEWNFYAPYQTYFKYLVNSKGEIDTIGSQIFNINAYFSGHIQFNKQGTELIRYCQLNSDTSLLTIFNFDRCSGMLKIKKVIDFNKIDNFLLFELSPSGRYMYPSKLSDIYQIDLESNEPYLFIDTLANHDYYDESIVGSSFGFTHLTPHDEIMVTSLLANPKAINIIHKPDLPGQASDFEQHALIGKVYATTSPEFPNYRLKELYGSPCDTVGFTGNELSWNIDTTLNQICISTQNSLSFSNLKLRLYDDKGDNILEEQFNSNQPFYCLETKNLNPGAYTWYLWIDDKKIVKGKYQKL